VGRDAGLRGPRGIAVAGGSLYVADCYNCELVRFDLASKARLGSAGGYGAGAGALRYPEGVAVGDDGATVYVADAGNSRVAAYAADSLAFKFAIELRRVPGGAGGGAVEGGGGGGGGVRGPLPLPRRAACRPAGLACADGELFVVDPFHRRLQATRRPAARPTRPARPTPHTPHAPTLSRSACAPARRSLARRTAPSAECLHPYTRMGRRAAARCSLIRAV
jgi:DNA-binding beta-propeller fold protein YncE